MENQDPVGQSAVVSGGAGWAVKYGDALLAGYRRMLAMPRFEAWESGCIRVGHAGLLVSAGLGLLAGLILAIKTDTFSSLLHGLAWVPLALVFQYVATKFIPADGQLLKNTPSALAGRAFLDCVGLIVFLAGLVFWIYSIVTGIRAEEWGVIGWGTGVMVFSSLVLLFTLNPETLCIGLMPALSAGEEAIGILSFFMKVGIRLVPVVYGVGVVLATLMLAVQIIGIFRGRIGDFQELGPTLVATGGSALFPLAAYLAFIGFILGVDVLRAILSVPRKLDDLIRK